MAKTGTSVSAAQILRTNEGVAEAGTAVAASVKTYNVPVNSNKNIVLCFIPTAAGNITIKKGTGLAATNDTVWPITASKANWIEVDTSSFALVADDGDDKGDMLLVTDGTVAGTLYVVNAL